MYPSSKYNVSAEKLGNIVTQTTANKIISAQEILRQFVFAWLTGNGDLHAKNISVISADNQRWELSPIYDIPSTAPYGDKSMALSVENRTSGLSFKTFIQFAESLGIKEAASRRLIQRILSDTEKLIEECSAIGFDSHRQQQLAKILKNRRLSLSSPG